MQDTTQDKQAMNDEYKAMAEKHRTAFEAKHAKSQPLTEPELSFIADMVTAYRTRRIKAIAKSVRKSPSSDLETLSLNSLISKLNALYLEALLAAYPAAGNDLPSPVATHADVGLPIIPLAESLG